MHLHLVSQNMVSPSPEINWFSAALHIAKLREQYICPHFRILIIGRANAGKTTILEKVCGVAEGTKPIVISDKKGKLDENPMYFLIFCSF